jgi:ABC-type sulfate/molybdate transport systems ATPase subunit
MRQELKRIHLKTKKTIMHITHDFKEMEILAQRAAILHNGKFIQIDTPENIMTKPANSFVADFIGLDNIIQGIADNGYFIPDDPDFKIPVSCTQRQRQKGYLVIPCHEIEVVLPEGDTENMFPAMVRDFKSRPPLLDLFLKGALNIKVTLPYSDIFLKKIQANREIFIGIRPRKCHFMSQ